MKPLIYKVLYEKEWLCHVQNHQKPNHSKSYEDWVKYGACGRGSSPKAAYIYWCSEVESALADDHEDSYYRSLQTYNADNE